MKGKCVYAGSFDPPHFGHLDIIGKCNMMFDEVVVAIGINESKKYTYPLKTRLEMLRRACRRYDCVTVKNFDGLLADFIREEGTTFYVRGIRDGKDAEYEEKCFLINSGKNEDIQTIFLPCSKETKGISSTLIKKLLAEGKSVEKYVPKEVLELL